MPLLILLFIVVPIAELYVIIKVGEAIGVLPTLAILIVDSFVGAALMRQQGRAAWRRFNEALEVGRVPAREVFDGALVILGGAFLLTPGFITDVIGLLLLIPPTRAVIRRLAGRVVQSRLGAGQRVATWGYRRARGGRGPGEGPTYPYGDPRGPASGGASPASRPGPPGGRRPGQQPGDIEGTAREVDEDEPPA